MSRSPFQSAGLFIVTIAIAFCSGPGPCSAQSPQTGTGQVGVTVKKDIPYAGTKNAAQTLDLYLPETNVEPNTKAKGKPLPLVVFIHGGAWRGGTKAAGRRWLRPLVASGTYIGASLDYRLTREAIWPAQIHDCKAAIRWLRGNAKTYNIDPDRIAVWGTSAGGHLVAMLGTTGGVESLEGASGEHIGTSSRVQAVIDFFGPTDLYTMNEGGSRMDHYAPDSPESILIGGPIRSMKQAARDASPITYVTKDDAPILIMHGTKDPLVPLRQSRIFKDALDQAGVPASLVTVEGGGHGFAGEKVTECVDAFLRRHLLGEQVKVPHTSIPAPPSGRPGRTR